MKEIRFITCLKKASSGLFWLCLIFFGATGGAKAANFVVTSPGDSGAGSLRQAVLNSISGDTITFTNTLSGTTITLGSGELLLGHNLTIDGSSLTRQLIINGNHTSRIFEVSSGINVSLNSLVITNGFPGTGISGGAILNSGTLALNNCTLAGNSVDSSTSGGAIANGGPLTLTGCTLSSNSAGFAGAINNSGTPCTLDNCTLSGNACANNGGAIDNTFGATLSLLYCTVSGNVAGGAGGGIDNYLSWLNVTNSILSGNISQDIYNWSASTNTFGGSNIVQSVGNAGTLIGGTSLLVVNPLLSPLGNYGGPTQTLPPSSGSPAIDAAGPALLSTDQRGYTRPIGAASDIGAVEVTSPTNSPFGNAMIFNGTNQYVTIPNFGTIIPTNEITMEFWAYTTAGAVQSAFMLNPDNNNDRLNAHLNYGGPASNAGNTYWDFGNISGGGRLGPVSAPANSISNWVHYAFVASQSGNYMSIYTNGILCATKSGMTPFVRGNYSLQIGGPGFPYHGAVDDFRVWSTARSQAQILADLGTPLMGSEPNLLLYYRFDDNGGNPAANSAIATGTAYNGTIVNGPGLENAGEPFAGGVIGSIAYTFTTLAGGSAAGNADGIGDAARFAKPYDVAVDTNGNIYVSDSDNSTIRLITPAGVVTTLAGLAGITGDADGVNGSARFSHPLGIARDNSGNFYVVDSDNTTIRKVTPSGVVSTLTSTDGTPVSANGPGVAVDSSGNIYSESGFAVIKFVPAGNHWVKTTLAGNVATLGYVDGQGANAFFNYPAGLVVDAATNVYVCDEHTAIRKITPAGLVTTIAGGTIGIQDGISTNAEFYSPFGIALDNFTNLYVADGNGHTVRKMTLLGTNWVVATLAGFPNEVVSGSLDGTGTNALFGAPWGVCVDSSGNLYVADYENNNIRKITSAAVVTTLAGPVNSSSYLDGTGNNARFNNPSGVTLDSAGNVYVADSQNQVIRKITTAGVVSTLAGLVGTPGEQDGNGNLARLLVPYSVAIDGSGNVYVADNFPTGKIRKITPAGVVSTIAGTGVSGYLDGPTNIAQFSSPAGITVDQSGNVYVAEQDYNTIRMIATNGIVSTIAGYPQLDSHGNPTNGYDNSGNHIGAYQDGNGGQARFNFPAGIAMDTNGNLYVADRANYVIRKIYAPATGSKSNPTNWMVTTLAGTSGVTGTNDGTGANAMFGYNFYYPGPSGVTVDANGNLYVTDNGNNTIRKITQSGVVTTIAGLAGTTGSSDGPGQAAQFDVPSAITVDTNGALYVADLLNNTIRKGTFTSYGPANESISGGSATNGVLEITLLPAGIGGQWRFGWETIWRASGTTASNLIAGNYPIEFRNLPGYLTIQTNFIAVVPPNTTTYLTNQYYPTLNDESTNSVGSLTVTLTPAILGGTGWRILGESSWRTSGSTAANLVPNVYEIQFEPVSGYATPANEQVQVYTGLPTSISAAYLLAASAPQNVLLPFPVPAGEIGDVVDYPFGFNGQLQSDVGYGSGVAVQPNVVLTAAHMVFNDQTLGYVSQVFWYFQQESGMSALQPQAARGWYVLSGYASQRTNDLKGGLGVDQSSPQSRNLDVAALYFLSPAAGGGYSGYLPADASPNPWLTGNSLKMLVGYPVDGSMFGDASIVPGEMYQTQPQPYPLALATDPVAAQQVYTANWFLSYPGNSGGPVYAQYDGYYYPAGVYLGTLYNGVTPYASLVRAIDSTVVNLITNAEVLGDNNTNNTGGGVITIVANQAINANAPGYLEFQLGPTAAVTAGAGWKLSGDSAYGSASNYIRAVTSTNISVLFNPIPGWNPPGNQAVVVLPGQITSYNASYTMANPVMVVIAGTGLGITGTTGTVYQIQYRTNLASGTWAPLKTNTLGSGFNVILPWPLTNAPAMFYRALWLP
ncbi:MAG TPA: choice-of-anchor Q domain-containing protein [Verrucomicrobiae bacterium]|jgi:hypothetical protein